MLSPRAVSATPYRRAVAGLVVVTLVWRAWTVSRWTWQDDDWLFIERSASMPLLEYLWQDYNSHVMPGGLLVTKLMVDISPLNFWLVVAVVSLACAASVALWGLAFERLTGGRLLALLPLAVIALSPAAVGPMMWWACAVTALPLQISLAVMVLLACAWVEHRRRRDLMLLGITFVVGLFFWEKSVFNAVPTAFVLLTVSAGGLRQRLRTIVVPCGLLAALAVPYLAFFLYWTRGATDNSVETSFAGHTLGSALGDYQRGLGQVFLPSLLGGPWGTLQRDGQVATPQPLGWTIAVLAVLAVGAAWLASRAPGALWILLLPLGYVVLTVSLVLFSNRSNPLWDVVLTDRYYVDSVTVAMLAAVLVIRQLPGPRLAPFPRRPLVVTGAALLVSSLGVGNALAAQDLGERPARHWVDNVRDGLHAAGEATSDDTVVVWDAYAPDDVLPSAYWTEHALLSRMLAPYGPRVRFGEAADDLWLITEPGHVRQAVVDPVVRARRGPVKGCGYAVSAGEKVVVRMRGKLYNWHWALQVNGFAGDGADLVVDLGDQELEVRMPPGLHNRKVQFEGAVPRKVLLRSESETGTACVSELFAGPVGQRSAS